MWLTWPLLEADGQLLCRVVLHFLTRFLFDIKRISVQWYYIVAVSEKLTAWLYPFWVHLQVVELDFLYPSEGVHQRWDGGFRITSTAATWDQAALVLSVPRRKPADETQETLRTSAFPSIHVKVFHSTLITSLFHPFFLSVNVYIVLFSPGEMGKESLYCISLLWSNCIMTAKVLFRCHSFYLIVHLYDKRQLYCFILGN